MVQEAARRMQGGILPNPVHSQQAGWVPTQPHLCLLSDLPDDGEGEALHVSTAAGTAGHSRAQRE